VAVDYELDTKVSLAISDITVSFLWLSHIPTEVTLVSWPGDEDTEADSLTPGGVGRSCFSIQWVCVSIIFLLLLLCLTRPQVTSFTLSMLLSLGD
jgi:hypothetical protein